MIEMMLMKVAQPPATSWTQLPAALELAENTGAWATEKYVYQFGGAYSSTTGISKVLNRYDIAAKTHSVLSPAASAKTRFSGCMYEGYIYILSGRGSRAAVNTAERYHIESDTWSTLAPPLVARSYTAACAVDGKIYVAGGRNNSNNSLNPALDVYDIATNKWSSLAILPTPGAFGTLININPGELEYVTDAVHLKYTIATNTWETIPYNFNEAPYIRSGVAINNKLYTYNFSTNQLMIYDGVNIVHIATPPPQPKTRSGHAFAANGDSIFIVGGLLSGGGQATREFWQLNIPSIM